MYKVKLSMLTLISTEISDEPKFNQPLSKLMIDWLDENCQCDYTSTYDSDMESNDMFVVYDFQSEDDALMFRLRFAG